MDELLPLINVLCVVISAGLMAIGWYFIRHKRKKDHIKMMLSAAFFAFSFFVLYLLKSILIGDTPFSGPEELKKYYLAFLAFHILLATAGGVFGLTSLLLAFRKRFARHRKIGPWTATIWFCTAVTGVMVYLILYVIYPAETTTGLTKAIFGI